MKKFLSAFLILILLFTCVACGKTDSANTDSTITTESTTENKTESTTNHTTDGETTTESTTEENTTETESKNTTKVQKEENTKENSNTKPTEKPSNPTTEKPTEKPTSKPTNPTTKPTEKPTTTEPSTSKPYFVSMDVVSVNRPNSFTVNGTHILDKIYGKNAVLQNGDTITYKMNMSDGGTTGFKLSYKKNCSVTTNGNIITVKVNGAAWSDAIVEFKVDTKTGSEIVRKAVGIYGVEGDLGTSASVQGLIREYASAKGMILLNGTEDEPVLDYRVKIPGNSNWKSEVFETIDKCANSG